jgi:uncharacterized membrane protein
MQSSSENTDLAERVSRLEAEVSRLQARLETALPPAAAEPGPAPKPSAEPLARTASATPTHSPTPARTAWPKPPRWSPPDWLTRLWSVNPLAKIGVILLFFGVASGLKLAAEYGLLPPAVRLVAASVLGLGLIALGAWQWQRGLRPVFAWAVEGGGIALLYLTTYFASSHYGLLPLGMAFGLYAALGAGSALLALRQDGQSLAVLGLAGAFLAPVLAGGKADTPWALFSYFAVLNTLLLGVSWRRNWRVLDVVGLVFTFGIGMAWGVQGYEHSHYAVTQGFVLLFFLAYSAMPVATVLRRAPGRLAWQDGTLLFGTPLATTFVQAGLLYGNGPALGLCAILAALWYAGLWWALRRRGAHVPPLLATALQGLAVFLVTLAAPLAFDAQVTSAFWAAEGSAVLWYGLQQGRLVPQWLGLGMQGIAGLALLWGWDALDHARPVFNDALLGAGLLVLAGLFSARVLKGATPVAEMPRKLQLPPPPALVPLLWAALWWLAPGLDEIDQFVAAPAQAAAKLLFVTFSIVVLEVLAEHWRWPSLRQGHLLLAIALVLGSLDSLFGQGHVYAGLMAAALPMALAVHFALLKHNEREGAVPLQAARHLLGGWTLVFTLALELPWQANEHLADAQLWPTLLAQLVLAGGLWLAVSPHTRDRWPLRVAGARYRSAGIALTASVMALVVLVATLALSGQGSGLPYLPLLSAFDLVQLWALVALGRATRGSEWTRPWQQLWYGATAVLAFLWLSTLPGRLAHAWFGVRFDWDALVADAGFQALLTLTWTAVAITVMIHASRQHRRGRWYGGFGLLCVVGAKLLAVDAADSGTLTWTLTLLGVAVLVLAASYFAPLPPRDPPAPSAARNA